MLIKLFELTIHTFRPKIGIQECSSNFVRLIDFDGISTNLGLFYA